MDQLKDELATSTAIPPQLVMIANDKGGEGKSTAALAVADHAFLHDAPLAVVQIDSQARLAQALGRKVLTIEGVQEGARRDPTAEAKAFTPLYELIGRAAKRGGHILVDCGANQARRFAHWSGLVDLEEDLIAWGFETTLVIPYVAEAEGMRQAAITTRILSDRLADARIVLVENERDGRFHGFHPASEAARVYRTEIEALREAAQATTLRMPLIEAGSWRPFEAAACRFVQVAGMPIDKVMALTGLPRPEAKIAKGDVAGWTADFFNELDKILRWTTAEGVR